MELTEFPEDEGFIKQVLAGEVWDKNGVFVDVGFGAGLDIITLADPDGINYQGPIIGIEPPYPNSPYTFAERVASIREYMEAMGKNNLQTKEGYVQNLRDVLPENSAKYVLAANVMQHVPERQWIASLEQIFSVLEPGGMYFDITNARGNKSKFHEALKNIWSEFGLEYPGPLSKKYNFEFAQAAIYSAGFDRVKTLALDSRLKINHEPVSDEDPRTRFDVVIESAETYAINLPDEITSQPNFGQLWLDARKKHLDTPILNDIELYGAHHDTLRRGAVIACKPIQ